MSSLKMQECLSAFWSLAEHGTRKYRDVESPEADAARAKHELARQMIRDAQTMTDRQLVVKYGNDVYKSLPFWMRDKFRSEREAHEGGMRR